MKTKGYNFEKIFEFVNLVKIACIYDGMVNLPYSKLCKKFKVGQGNTKEAFKKLNYIEFNGNGFKNWIWIGPKILLNEHVKVYIQSLNIYNDNLRYYRKENKKPVFEKVKPSLSTNDKTIRFPTKKAIAEKQTTFLPTVNDSIFSPVSNQNNIESSIKNLNIAIENANNIITMLTEMKVNK